MDAPRHIVPENLAVTRNSILIEACVDGIDGLLAAQQAGAGRIELCAALSEGGITPGPGAFREALRRATVPVHVMIRPRGGDFLYSETEFSAMLEDAAHFSRASGIVSGFLTPQGTVDEERVRAVAQAAAPASFTFHRAFDMARDPFEAMESLIACGAARILTSGGRATALEGSATLRELNAQAAGRITLIACGGVRADNLARLRAETGIREFHCGPVRLRDSGMLFRNPGLSMGGKPGREYQVSACDAEAVRAVAQAARSA